MSNTGMGSASGYTNITDTPLASKEYHNMIIALGWEKDFLSEIVNNRIVARAFDCNQVVEFLLQPTVGPWRPYEDNQVIQPDQVSLTSVQMTLCNQAYKALKFDNKFKRDMCQFWSKFEDAFLDSCYKELSGMWHQFVLSAMVLESSRFNKGANAGRFKNINLGVRGRPIRITEDNIANEIQKLQMVLNNQNRWKDNEMFLLIPPELAFKFTDSIYVKMQQGCCNADSILLTGEMPGRLFGFRVIQSQRTPSGFDEQANAIGHYILAFWKEAYAFHGDIVEGRIIEDKDYFGFQYQMEALWGGKAIYNDAIAVGYWTIA